MDFLVYAFIFHGNLLTCSPLPMTFVVWTDLPKMVPLKNLVGLELYWCHGSDNKARLYCPSCEKSLRPGPGGSIDNLRDHFRTPKHEKKHGGWFKVNTLPHC